MPALSQFAKDLVLGHQGADFLACHNPWQSHLQRISGLSSLGNRIILYPLEQTCIFMSEALALTGCYRLSLRSALSQCVQD